MKKALGSFFSLLIMAIAFVCFSGKVSASEEVWIKSIDYLQGIRSTNPSEDTRFYMMAMGYNGDGEIVLCINSKAIAPGEDRTPNPQKYFFVGENKGLSADVSKKIPGIISIIKNSKNNNIMKNNSGKVLTARENYFVTQYTLWYYIEGLGGKVVTSNGLSWIKSSRFSNVFNTLIENANKATSNGYTNPSVSIISKNGELSDGMSSVDGTTLKISDTVFGAKFTGTSNNNQDYKVTLTSSNGTDRSYITDESGKANYGSNHVFKANEGFRIIIDTSYATTEKFVEVPFNVTGTKEESKDVLKVYSALNSSLNFQDVAMVSSNKVTFDANYTVNTNIEKKHEMFIKKVNKNGDALEGASLEIYNSDTNELVTSIISEKDASKLTLAPGKYYIKEIKAPNGYLLSDGKKYFSVENDGVVKDEHGYVVSTKTIHVVNYLPIIKIRKVNEKKVDVKNVKIVICSYDVNSKKESNCNFEWITDGTTKELTIGKDFGSLDDGSYIIKEVSAPHGYELSDPKYVTIKDGKLYGDIEDDTVTFINKAYLEVSKTDATGQKELDGADMKLLSSSGELIDKWISSSKETHKVSGLMTNEIYEIVENAAPEGYYPISTSIKFRINDDGQVETLDCTGSSADSCKVMSKEDILKIKNEVIKIKISKIDITNGQELPGATLQILHEDGSPVYQDGKILEWVSTDKPHEITMLPAGKYKLVETFSPEGYVAVSNEVEFTVKADGKVETVVFKNDVTKVMISKKDFTNGEEIEGAHLQIIDESGKVIHEWTSGKEPHYIEKLPVGKYTLVETLPATGYENGMYIDGDLTSKYNFEVKDNILLKIDVYNKTMSVPITDFDASSTYVIGGATVIIGLGTVTFARRKRERV